MRYASGDELLEEEMLITKDYENVYGSSRRIDRIGRQIRNVSCFDD
jgi:hypothetical protein